MKLYEIDELSLEDIAHHEAGHATAACVLPHARPVSVVTLESDLEGFRAHCVQEPIEPFLQPDGSVPTTDEFRAMVRADMGVVMAGPYAERRFAGESHRDHIGIASDFLQAQEMADELLFSPEQETMAAAEAAAQQVVDEFWAAISAVALALLDKGSLDGDAVGEIIGLTMRGIHAGE